LEFESWRGCSSEIEYTEYDIFRDIEIYNAFPALERSKFANYFLQDYIKKEKIIEFCKFLLMLNDKHINELSIVLKFTEFEIASLQSIKHFQKLLSKINETHYADAFHLWTAERNNLDFFLTLDKKFINVIRNSQCDIFECQPILPEEYDSLFI
jgi:predicted nucleic acid-binding protein